MTDPIITHLTNLKDNLASALTNLGLVVSDLKPAPTPTPTPTHNPIPIPTPTPTPSGSSPRAFPTGYGINVAQLPTDWDDQTSHRLTDWLASNALLYCTARDGQPGRDANNRPAEDFKVVLWKSLSQSDLKQPMILSLPADYAPKWSKSPDQAGLSIIPLAKRGDMQDYLTTFSTTGTYDNNTGAWTPATVNGQSADDAVRTVELHFEGADLKLVQSASEMISWRRQGDTSTKTYTNLGLSRYKGMVGLRFMDLQHVNGSVEDLDQPDAFGPSGMPAIQEMVDGAGPTSIKWFNFPCGATDAFLQKQAAFDVAQTQWRGIVAPEHSNEPWNPFLNLWAFQMRGFIAGKDVGDHRGPARCAYKDLVQDWGWAQLSSVAVPSGRVVSASGGAYFKSLKDAPVGTNWDDASYFTRLDSGDDPLGAAADYWRAERTARACDIYLAAGMPMERIRPILSTQPANEFGNNQRWNEALTWAPVVGGRCVMDFWPMLAFPVYFGAGMSVESLRSAPNFKSAILSAIATDSAWIKANLITAEANAQARRRAYGLPDIGEKAVGIYEGGLHLVFAGLSDAEAQQLNQLRFSDKDVIDALTAAYKDMMTYAQFAMPYMETGFPYEGNNQYDWAHYFGTTPAASGIALERALGRA